MDWMTFHCPGCYRYIARLVESLLEHGEEDEAYLYLDPVIMAASQVVVVHPVVLI